jgi:NhaP-type Na+/H+ or K+/H+ antiporter
MTTEQLLIGVSLTLLLAVASQVLAGRLRLPALIVLLPVGFGAGALTPLVNARDLLGPLFEPVIAFSVAVILFDACLSLDVRRLRGSIRRVVAGLLAFGVPTTWAFAGFAAALLLDVSTEAAVMIGAILVVSGPTVVGPLLAYVQPTDRLEKLLNWESTLIDPIGGILGAIVFHAIVESGPQSLRYEAGQFLASVVVGVGAGVVGGLTLWLVLRLGVPEVLGTAVTIAFVVAVAAAADVVRDDTGLIAAIVMGLLLGSLPGIDMAAHRPFFETVVHLILGVLFISISATVTPASVGQVLLPTLALVGVLVVVARPLVAFAATMFTDLSRGERAFLGWMAPRGIVAAATASAFAPGLVAEGVGGAGAILPATFLVIVVTVTLYGLTAAPVARLLGVARSARTRPFLVGGAPWVIDLGRALVDAGLEVVMWAGREPERENIRAAGLELATGELLAAATGRRAELEGINAVFLLSEEDDFNALAVTILQGNVDGPVYRVAASETSQGVAAPFLGGEPLFSYGLNRVTIDERHRRGGRIEVRTADEPVAGDDELLFLLRPDRRLEPVTSRGRPTRGDNDRFIVISAPRDGAWESAAGRSESPLTPPG